MLASVLFKSSYSYLVVIAVLHMMKRSKGKIKEKAIVEENSIPKKRIPKKQIQFLQLREQELYTSYACLINDERR